MTGFPAFFTRIRFKIMAIVLMAIIPALILIFVSATARKQQVARDIEANAMSFNRFLASNIQRDLSEAHGFLASIAMTPIVGELEEKECREALSSLIKKVEVYENIGLADSQGNVRCSAHPMEANLSPLPWFRKSLSHPGFTVGFDFESVLSRGSSLNLSLPIPHEKRILFATMSLDWISQVLASARLPEGFVISVTDSSGATVARYPDPERWRGKSLQDSSGTQSVLKEGVVEAKGLDGVRRIYAVSTVPGEGGLIVRVGILRDKVYAAVNREAYRHLMALGVVSILALMAAWFGGDVFLLRQVNTLIRATRKLAEGDMGARTALPYDKGELGQLAKAFDEMAESLEWRQAQLQESEKERMEGNHPFKEALGAAPSAIIILDNDMKVVHINRQAEKVLGRGLGDVVGTSIASICPNLPAGEMASRDNTASAGDRRTFTGQVTRGGGPIPLEFQFTRLSRSSRGYWMALVRFHGPGGDGIPDIGEGPA